MKAFILIIAISVCWALAAKTEHVSQEGKMQEKRKLYDFGKYANNNFGNQWSSSLDFGGSNIGSGNDFTNSNDGQAEKGITKIAEKMIPVLYTLEKHLPYTIEKEVKVPCPVSQNHPVETKLPDQVRYEVPVYQSYIVDHKLKVPVNKPYKDHVLKPYPVTVEQHLPVAAEVKVPFDKRYPVEVGKPVPYKANVPVHPPYITENKLPAEVETPVNILVNVPVDKPSSVYEKVPVSTENEVPEHIPIKIYSQVNEENERDNGKKQWRPIIRAQNDAGNEHVAQFQQHDCKGLTHQSNFGEGTNHQQVDVSHLQTYQSNQQQLELTQLQHKLTSDYGTVKHISQANFPGKAQATYPRSYVKFSSGNDANKGQKQENIHGGNIQQVQWQHSIPELSGYNIQEQGNLYSNANIKLAQNDFEFPEKNIETENNKYQTAHSTSDYGLLAEKEQSQPQNNYDLLGQIKNKFGHEFTQQIQNNIKGFAQLQQVDYETTSKQIPTPAIFNDQQQQLIYSQQHPQQNDDHLLQWQGQPTAAVELQDYTYKVPEKSNSLPSESGNGQQQPVSCSELAQQNLGLKNEENPQQEFTSYDYHVNHEALKPGQLQIDYASYGKSFAQQAQALIQQQSAYLGADGNQLKYQGQIQQPGYTAHDFGSYRNYAIAEDQQGYQGLEQPEQTYTSDAGSASHQKIGNSHETIGQREPKYKTQVKEQLPGSSIHQAVEQGELSYSQEKDYNALELHQPTYASYVKSSSHSGQGGSNSFKITKKGQNSFKILAQKAVKQDGTYDHDHEHQTYISQTNQQPKYTSSGKEISFSQENIRQEPQKYTSHAEPCSHQATGSSGHDSFGQGKQNYKAQQSSYLNQGEISSHKTNHESIIKQSQEQSGSSSHTSTDHGQQHYGNYEGSSLAQQAQQQLSDSSNHRQQVTFGTVERSGYESKASSTSEAGQKKSELQKIKS